MKDAACSDHERDGAADELDRLVEAEIVLLERRRPPRTAHRTQAEPLDQKQAESIALAPEEKIAVERVARWLRARSNPALILKALTAAIVIDPPAPPLPASSAGSTDPEMASGPPDAGAPTS